MLASQAFSLGAAPAVRLCALGHGGHLRPHRHLGLCKNCCLMTFVWPGNLSVSTCQGMSPVTWSSVSDGCSRSLKVREQSRPTSTQQSPPEGREFFGEDRGQLAEISALAELGKADKSELGWGSLSPPPASFSLSISIYSPWRMGLLVRALDLRAPRGWSHHCLPCCGGHFPAGPGACSVQHQHGADKTWGAPRGDPRQPQRRHPSRDSPTMAAQEGAGSGDQ